ncbi:MAG: hypothetical protein QOH49_165 [Acidobacteriota bacterium]|jgi:hypothetical protein|nr:hypothetical protein [Acidobacteriota bacterium]
MMKATLTAILLLCVMAAIAAAQGEDDRRGAPGVEVSAFEWKYEGYAPVEVVRSSKSGVALKVERGTDYVFKYDSRLTVRNTGAKAVKSIEWAHIFYDPGTGKELKRYRLQSKQRVAAGETLTLSKAVFIKPEENTRHLTTGKQRVQITRVEFEGGGDWKVPETDGRKP